MTTDADCIFGVPRSIIIADRAIEYFHAVDRAIYMESDLSGYDRDVVWHTRQWQTAFERRQPELAALSRRRALDAAERVVRASHDKS